MTETRELRSVLSAAEQAANAGDYAAAEPLLREAALLLETSLGPQHPELANTLNNLAVVCELTGKLDEAEQFYRRAHVIASSALKPDHELVLTSERNLQDFCRAHGRPFEPRKRAAELTVEREVSAASSAGASIERPMPNAGTPGSATPKQHAVARAPDVPQIPAPERPAELSQPLVSERPIAAASSKRSAPSLRVGLLSATALAAFVAGFFWFRAQTPDGSPTTTTSPARVQTTPSPHPSPPAQQGTSQPSVSSTPAKPTTPTTAQPPLAAEPSPTPSPIAPSPSSAESKRAVTRTAPTDTTLDIVDAELCRSLSRAGAWRCSPVNDPVDAGRLYFYTRLKVPRATTVNHRWYRGNRLVQAVELRIQPSASAGYRTFSQNTVTVGSGDWRVELTSGDGAVLHEVRFVVR